MALFLVYCFYRDWSRYVTGVRSLESVTTFGHFTLSSMLPIVYVDGVMSPIFSLPGHDE